MDNKITKKRLSELLAYDWLKILGLGILSVFAWVLIFSFAAPRLLRGQDFSLFITPFVNRADDYFVEELYDKKESILSYDILKKYVNKFNAKAANELMSTRAATHEGDIFIADAVWDKDEFKYDKEKPENNVIQNCSLQTYLDAGYNFCVIDDFLLEGMLYGAKFFKDEFVFPDCSREQFATNEQITQKVTLFLTTLENYNTSYEDMIDDDKVLQAFKQRKKKDNAYKTKKQYQAGAVKDKARIVKVLKESVEVYKALARLDAEYGGYENNPLRLNYHRFEIAYTLLYYEVEGDVSKMDQELVDIYNNNESLHTYGISLGGIESAQIGGVSIARKDAIIGNSFRLATNNDKATAEGVAMSVFAYQKYQADLHFESVFVIRHVLNEFTTLFDN